MRPPAGGTFHFENLIKETLAGPWRLRVGRSIEIFCSRSLPTSKSTGLPRLKKCVSNLVVEGRHVGPLLPTGSLNSHQCLRQFLVQAALFVLAELLWLKNHAESREHSGKGERHPSLVRLQHRGSSVLSDVKGFIERKSNAYRLRNATLRDLPLVYQQRRSGCFADPATIVFELDADDMIAGRERLVGRDAVFVLGLIGKGIGKDGFAILHQQRPAAVATSYCCQHAIRAAFWDGHLGGDRP